MEEVQAFSEEYIEKALQYLKYHDPANATREKATDLLHDIKSGLRSLGQHDPDALSDLQELINKNKQ